MHWGVQPLVQLLVSAITALHTLQDKKRPQQSAWHEEMYSEDDDDNPLQALQHADARACN